MSLGISPCPPFGNRAGLPPGSLYDGNTVAWYKYNDPVAGVVRDGADRVSVWLDKMGYSISADLLGGYDFNDGTWVSALAAGAVVNSTTFSSAGANGGIRKNNIVIIGGFYKCVVSGNSPIPDVRFRSYGGGIYNSLAPAGGAFDLIFYFTATDLGFGFSGDGPGNITINSFTVQLITGNHLLQATGADQPLWSAADGVLFDGVTEFMKTATFIYTQPCFIYLVFRQITWMLNRRIFDADIVNDMRILQNPVTHELRASAGIGSPSDNSLNLNNFGIIRVLYHGINSTFQINNNAVNNGNWGAGDANGLTLGCQGNGGGGYANIEVKEIILRNIVDVPVTQTEINNYLQNANGVTF